MSGWSILAQGMVAACGVLMFLKLAAHSIERVGRNLEVVERREARIAEKRRESANAEADPSQPAPSTSSNDRTTNNKKRHG